jgi:hypothetical protein
MPKSSELTQAVSETVSYSRLSSYVECPSKYANKYVRKVPAVNPIEDYFLKGTLAHRGIEEFLLGAEKEIAIEAVLPEWLVDNCHLPIVEKGDDELGIEVDTLLEYCYPVAELLIRCMSSYKDSDAIRNNDGSVPNNPLLFPPSSFKSEYNKLGLQRLRSELDLKAVQCSLPFRRFSLANTAAQAIAYIKAFRLPGWVDEVIGVEFDLTKVPIRWDENTTWNGAIDLVVKNKKGETVIIDHKSEKSKATPIQVAFHPQLNVYARIYYEITGVMPDYLGINHLPSGEMILAKTDPSIVLANYNYWETIREKIAFDRKHDNFAKQLPTKYNSPCIRRDWKSNVITQVCPYLTTCWPDYSRYINRELEPFLTEQSLKDANI